MVCCDRNKVFGGLIMRKILFLIVLLVASSLSAKDFYFVNYSGHVWTNSTWAASFPPGLMVVRMTAPVLSKFSSTAADGSQDVQVAMDDISGEVVTVMDSDTGFWFNRGLLIGIGLGGFAFALRFVRQVGRTSPEV